MKRMIGRMLPILGMLSFMLMMTCNDTKNQDRQENRDNMRNREEPGMRNDRDTTDQRMEDYEPDTTGL